jgi:hypothetical protein
MRVLFPTDGNPVVTTALTYKSNPSVSSLGYLESVSSTTRGLGGVVN